jgi:hypothetical protein
MRLVIRRLLIFLLLVLLVLGKQVEKKWDDVHDLEGAFLDFILCH